jgi:protein arginine kinase activator
MTASICPQCGLSIGEFHKTGRLGCSECYTVFRDELMPVFRRIHGHDHHVGKVPALNPLHMETRKTLLVLRRQLKQAVEREEFEKAAELRDRINAIEHVAEPQLPV